MYIDPYFMLYDADMCSNMVASCRLISKQVCWWLKTLLMFCVVGISVEKKKYFERNWNFQLIIYPLTCQDIGQKKWFFIDLYWMKDLVWRSIDHLSNLFLLVNLIEIFFFLFCFWFSLCAVSCTHRNPRMEYVPLNVLALIFYMQVMDPT